MRTFQLRNSLVCIIIFLFNVDRLDFRFREGQRGAKWRENTSRSGEVERAGMDAASMSMSVSVSAATATAVAVAVAVAAVSGVGGVGEYERR